MKILKKLFLCLSVGLLPVGLTSCGSDNDDNGGGTGGNGNALTEDINQRSCSIAEGAEVYAMDVTYITISYNATVSVNPAANVTLNGTKLAPVSSPKTKMDIVIPVNLEPGMSYTLTVPSGSVVATTDAKRTAKAFTLHFTTKKQDAPGGNLPDNDATRLSRKLGWGWNLGNHFDSYDGNNADANYRITWSKDCPYWDGENPTAELYQNLAKAGAKTVRIPVTWGPYQNMTDGKYTIDADYMAVVKQNVLWARDAGLNVILNTHHDEYWMDAYEAGNNSSANTRIKERITALWTQVAEAFKGEGDYLIFESFNELNHNWATPRDAELKIQNEWNQLVVDVVRSTGGNNATRWIAVPSYQASASYALNDAFKVPTDAAGKIIVAVHNYDPYNFTLQNPLSEKWGNGCGSANDEKNITDLLMKVCSKFIANNQPCYLGEYGCSIHTTALGEKCREYYLEYFCRAAYYAGLPLMLWDNNVTKAGSEAHGYFSHKDGKFLNNSENLVKTMVKAATSDDSSYTLDKIKEKAPKK